MPFRRDSAVRWFAAGCKYDGRFSGGTGIFRFSLQQERSGSEPSGTGENPGRLLMILRKIFPDCSGIFHADGNGGGSGADQQELIVRREGVRREPEHGLSAFRREAVFKFRDSSWIQEQGTPGRRTPSFRMDGDFAPKRGWAIVFNGNPPMAGAGGLHRGYSRKTRIFQRFPYTPCGLAGGNPPGSGCNQARDSRWPGNGCGGAQGRGQVMCSFARLPEIQGAQGLADGRPPVERLSGSPAAMRTHVTGIPHRRMVSMSSETAFTAS